MPSVSKKQHNFMAAVANNPKFAKKAGVSSAVGKEFLTADKGKTFKEGGTMKKIDAKKNPGMAKLPTAVRNKMGFMKDGGAAHSDIAKDKPMMKKVAAKAVKGHEKKLHGMAKGGGVEIKGKTKGKMIKMKDGGSC
jgi:phosphoserine phosphatase